MSMLTEPAERRLVLLARFLGPAPSRAKLRRAVRLVEADAELDEIMAAASWDLSGAAWRGVNDALDAAGAADCGLGLGMLDLLVALGEAAEQA